MSEGCFDDLLQGPDVGLFWGVITRIEDHAWHPSKMRGLPREQVTVLRVAYFGVIFGNGGLQYWFEQDSTDYGLATVEDLRAVGLHRSADAMATAYGLFKLPADWEDWDRRMGVVAASRSAVEASERVLWSEFKQLELAAGRFIKDHRIAFDDLRHRASYDPVSKSYRANS